MLLARKGYRVLLVDRATFPSDTVSTHVVQPLAAAALGALGAARAPRRDRLPADRHLRLRLRAVHARRGAGHRGGSRRLLPAPHGARQDPRRRRGRGGRRGARGVHRRRESFAENGRVVGIRAAASGGEPVTERAARRRRRRRPELAAWRTRSGPERTTRSRRSSRATTRYWSGLPMGGRFETYIRDRRGFAAVETHDGLTLVIARLAASRSSRRTRRTSRATT